MSLLSTGHDYDQKEKIVDIASGEAGQEEEMVEEVENYFDESDDIENATPNSLTSPDDVLNNEDPEWQEDFAEEASEEIDFDRFGEDGHSACTESIADEESSPEDYFDFVDEPSNDDSLALPLSYETPACKADSDTSDGTVTEPESPVHLSRRWIPRGKNGQRVSSIAKAIQPSRHNSIGQAKEDEATKKSGFDFAYIEDYETSVGTDSGVGEESSPEDLCQISDDVPFPDDSDAPQEISDDSQCEMSVYSVAEETLSSEDLSTPCDDVPPPPDDSMAPPENSQSSPSNKSTNTSDEDVEEDDLPKMFSTNAGIKGDYYGTYQKKQDSEDYMFKPLGRAILLKNVVKDITNNTYSYVVSFQTETDVCEQTISKEDAMNVRTIQTLCKYGADIPQKHVNVVIDSLRAQEELNFIKKQRCSFIHTDLGWQEYIDVKSGDKKRMFKAASTVGDNFPARSKYRGNMAIRHHGTFKGWKDMVVDHVLGRPAMETILVAALSSVIVGLIGLDRLGGESPILHFADSSSSGKTTAAMLAASVGGRPFKNSGVNPKTGKVQESLCQDWGGTQNALIAKQRGNKGYPIILDELSKVGKVDLATLIYFFGEGTEKDRMNEEKGTGFMSSTISFGEVSLIEQCRSKNEGIRVRVLEVSGQLTDSASHSDSIKRLCQENYGWATKMLARYILDNGGKDYVTGIFDELKEKYFDAMPDCLNKDRLFNKFHGAYLTTAVIARKALGIKFDLQSIFEFLNSHIEKRIEFGNSSQNAYEQLLEKFRANPHHIRYNGANYDNKVECWGAYSDKTEVAADGNKIIGEYSIRVNLFAKLLKDLGFENKDTIIKDFKKLGYLNFENDRNTRRRKIGSGTAELCYVIRVFEVEESKDDLYEEIKPSLQVTKTQSGTYYIGIGGSNVKPPISKPTENLLA